MTVFRLIEACGVLICHNHILVEVFLLHLLTPFDLLQHLFHKLVHSICTAVGLHRFAVLIVVTTDELITEATSCMPLIALRV